MLSLWSTFASLGLLTLSVKATEDRNHNHDQDHDHQSHGSYVNETTICDPLTTYDPTCTGNVTVIDTTTIPTTHYVDVIVSNTETRTVSVCVTESSTTTVRCTVSITETDLATVTDTETTTATVPATVTTYTTQTIISTTVDPCPTECSISAATVNVFFWPTDRPYSYPSTYYDTALDYTFTSPSVYILIPSAKGTNSIGDVGPNTKSWIVDLDLTEVSTIVGGTLTRQLSLSDLGTDCAQTADPTAIATLVDSRCDPILAAPKKVSSWAYPCNACGHFGLFDPPYAIPTLTGGLIETTVTPQPVETTAAPAPTSTPATGVLVVVSFSDGTAVATATMPTTGITGTVTTSVGGLSNTDPTSEIVSTADSGATTNPPLDTTTAAASPSIVSSSAPASVATGSATKVAGGVSRFILYPLFVVVSVSLAL